MRVLMFGAGVIGTIYGYLLAQAGNEVTHYVRPGKKQVLANGIEIRLLDGRSAKPKDTRAHYALNLVDALSPRDGYDLVVVSVRHYQLDAVIPLIKENLGQADLLFFNGNWAGLEAVDRCFSRSQYLWGFPVAGGGFTSAGLDGAVLAEIHLGEMDGQRTPRLEQVTHLFGQAGLNVDVQDHMLHWLWVHFAINCGIIGAAFRAGGASQLINSVPNLHEAILAGREALAVCQARGVDVKSFADAQAFNLPAWLGAIAVWWMMKTNEPARNIMERHTAIDELQQMYWDLFKTGEELRVPMPHYQAFRPYVEHPQVLAHH